MPPLDPIRFQEQGREEFNYLAATRQSSFSEYFGAKLSEGFDYTLSRLALDTVTGVGERYGPLPSDGTTREQMGDMGYELNQRRITEDEWSKLGLNREGLEFSGGGTIEYEQRRTADFDERRYRDSLIQRYQGNAGTYALGFGASLLGSLPSIENFIPFVPEAMRARMVARLGTIGGRAAAGALDATLGTLAIDAAVLPDLARRGEDVGVGDLALDVALGAVLGSAFGAGGGVLQARREAREALARFRDGDMSGGGVSPAIDPDAAAANAIRIDGLTRQADAIEVALAAVAGDEPVDVGPILSGIDSDVRRRLAVAIDPNARAAPTPRPEVTVAPRLPDPDEPAGAVGQERAFTAGGRAVDVEYEVVELADLTASNTDDLAPNPAYPPELQPRDRSRAASADQIRSIAANLEPELLGRSATASEGAPIVGPDYVVESGNARVLALRKVFAESNPNREGSRAKAYLDFLKRQGFDVEGMTAPVLVRRRTTDLPGDERASFTLEANQRSVAAMGAGERAMSDARNLDNRSLGLIAGPDLYAKSNLPFVRAFVATLPPAERADMLTAAGELSRVGRDRIGTALLARAYGDAELVARLAEDPDSGLGQIAGALVEVAPQWSTMRAEMEMGSVAPEGDGTPGLLDALRAVRKALADGEPAAFALTQQDMFGGGLSIEGRAFLMAMLEPDGRLLNKQKMTVMLQEFVADARKQPAGPSLLGEQFIPLHPEQILTERGRVRAEVGKPLRAIELGREGIEQAVDVGKRQQPFEDLDGLYGKERADGTVDANSRAMRYQRELEAFGPTLEGKGVTFKKPRKGAKAREDAASKIIRKDYKSARALTDIIRAGFLVDTPADAERVVAALSKRYRLIDEGFTRTDQGYFDGKVLLQFDDGTIGEVQLWEPNLFEAKEGSGGGHKIYDVWRDLPADDPRKAPLQAQMVELYDGAAAAAGPAWAGPRLGQGPAAFRAPANIDLNIGSPSTTRPDSYTSASSTSVQALSQGLPAPPSTANDLAASGNLTAGRPSQLRNLGSGIGATPAPDMMAGAPRSQPADYTTKASEVPPHPSVVEAAVEVKRAPPKDGLEAAARQAEALAVGDVDKLPQKIEAAEIAASKTESLSVTIPGMKGPPIEVVANPRDRDVRQIIKDESEASGSRMGGLARVIFDAAGNLTHVWQASAAIHGQIAKALGLGEIPRGSPREAMAELFEGRVLFMPTKAGGDALPLRQYVAENFPQAVAPAPRPAVVPDDIPAFDDIRVLRRDGLLSAADEAELEAADDLVKEADGWATAYETLATCVLRFGE